MRHGFAGALMLGALWWAGSADPAAHHAVQAAFDQDDHATVTGVLTKVLWINPHVRWFLDVKDESGKVDHLRRRPGRVPRHRHQRPRCLQDGRNLHGHRRTGSR